MNRVVTSQALLAAADGYLPSDLYGQMATVSGGPILSAKAMLKMFFTVSLGKDGNRGTGSAYNFSIVQFNDFVLSGYEQNTAYLGTCKFLKLTVPTYQLRYPTRPLSGAPTPAWNMIVLKSNLTSLRDPDTLRPLVDNQPINFLFDAELQYKAMAPIMLVHGTNAKPNTWDVPGNGHSFNDYFSTFPGLCFNDITLLPNGSVNGNGEMLEAQIVDRLASVGAKRCHIVAHSKGGNDSRAMIKRHYDQHLNKLLYLSSHFEVLSLYTLDTPHRGTVMADISWAVRNAKGSVVADPNWAGLQSLINLDYWWLHQSWPLHPDSKAFAPTGDALDNNRTTYMNTWNLIYFIDFYKTNSTVDQIIPIKFYNTAANADWNVRNLQIDSTENFLEGGGLIYGDGVQYPFNLATPAYQMLYWAKRVDAHSSTRPVTVKDKEGNTYTINRIVTELFVPVSSPQANGTWNDSVVALDSAIYEGGIPFSPSSIPSLGGVLLGNHSGIKTRTMASEIVNQIRSDWVIQ